MRICIVGGPGCGKSTLALREASKLGCLVLCTDTLVQAQATGRAQLDGVLYAPEGMTWSGLSEWVSDEWLSRRGPWVMEGVALARALRKWHAANPGEPPPCEKVIWCTEPRMELTYKQISMLDGHDTIMHELVEWEGLRDRLEMA